MWFGILGATEVRRADGQPVAAGGPRLRALLTLLLLDAGKVVSTERLVDGLYGGDPPDGVANALQSQVSRLRHLLRDADDAAPAGLVVGHPAGYRLAVDPDDVDAHRFARLAAEGRRALTAGDHPKAATVLRDGLALWRGPALADLSGVPFAAAQATRLEELRLAATEDRAEAELALGGHRELAGELQELVAAHPLRERLRGLLIRALAGGGRQAEALAVFEDARRTLADRLGADPSPELSAVHLEVLRGSVPTTTGATDVTDPSAPTAVPLRALPAQLTSFVGRADDLGRVGKLLAAARLVTLTGSGGAGKTRMAVEAARREPGEVCLVELAAVGDGAELPQVVVAALGLREGGQATAPGRHPRPDPVGRLAAALADRPMLLVLDNCEHVVEAAAQLTDRLLGVCPTLRVLATSREPLGITGETLCPVGPLALPPPGATVGEQASSPAVRLFADRAAAVAPDFTVDAGNIGAVVRICAALDGLPLAIELAAARVRTLPVAEVAARLDDRFRLLSRGSRTAAPRHQTLRAVVAWSWDLLGEPERMLARRLTVFAGGASPEAAARICGVAESEALDLLTQLADKSLVQVGQDGGLRYRMLDTVRAFGAERLAEAGEQEQVRRAHAAYLLALAQAADPYLHAAGQLEWLARLDAERDDLHAALRWATAAAEVATALRLVAALSMYWWLRGLRSDSAALAGELLATLPPEPPDGLEEEYALCVLNAAAESGGQDLRAPLKTAERIVIALDRQPRHPSIFLQWALATGPPSTEVTAQLEDRMRRTAVDPWSRALVPFSDGYIQLFNGRPAAAEEALTSALERFRALGERWGMSMSLAELARLADRRGDRHRSAALTSEAIALAGQLDMAADLSDLLCMRADSHVREGDLDGAEAGYQRAVVFARRAGAPEMLAGAHRGLGEVARLRGDLPEARRLCETALAECQTGWYGAEETRSRVLVALGRIAEAEGDPDAARRRHRQALTAAVGSRNLPAAAEAAEGLAGVALLEADADRAALLLGAGVALRGGTLTGDPDVDRVAEAARALLGDAAYASAHREGASMPHDQALALLGAPPTSAKLP